MEKEEVRNSYLRDMKNLMEHIYRYSAEMEVEMQRAVVSHTSYRLKSEESTAQKLVRKGHEVTNENAVQYVNDLAGIRIVCLFLDDVYLMLKYIRENTAFRIIKEKDFVKKPKDSGYQSIHVIVQCESGNKVEIQLRTMAMDCWAVMEYQLQYKKGKEKQKLKKQLSECAKTARKFDERMLDLKNNLSA